MRAPQVYFPELMEILHSRTLGKDVMHFWFRITIGLCSGYNFVNVVIVTDVSC